MQSWVRLPLPTMELVCRVDEATGMATLKCQSMGDGERGQPEALKGAESDVVNFPSSRVATQIKGGQRASFEGTFNSLRVCLGSEAAQRQRSGDRILSSVAITKAASSLPLLNLGEGGSPEYELQSPKKKTCKLNKQLRWMNSKRTYAKSEQLIKARQDVSLIKFISYNQ